MPNKKLTNKTNTPNMKDAYGNMLWKMGDEFPPFSTRDPAGSGAGRAGIGIGAPAFGPLETENPYGGDYIGPEPIQCDTCSQSVSIVEMSTPSHLGHNLRYGDGKTNFDVDNVAKTGGGYSITSKVEANPLAWAPDPIQNTNPKVVATDSEATLGTVADQINDTTQAM